jgi:tetratricopeptide (TPR) repeat protein
MMENSRRLWKAAVVLILILLVTVVAWVWHRESTESALAEDFAQEVLHVTPSGKTRDRLWTDALTAVAHRRRMTERQLESRLRSFASGSWTCQPHQGRKGAIANIIERHWFSAASGAREVAAKQVSFANLYLLGNLAYLLDDVREARTALTAALEQPEGAPLLRAAVQIRLGAIELIAGQTGRARPLSDAALRTLESIHPSDDSTLAAELALASGIALADGQIEEVEQLDQRLVVLIERLQGPDSAELVNHLAGLGRIAIRRNRLDDAERHLQRAVEIVEKTRLDDLHAGVALSSLGELLRRRGHLQEAETQTLKGLRLIEKSAAGPDSMTAAYCLESLGSTLNALLRPAEAVQRLERCIEIWQRHGDTESPDLANVISELGAAYYELGRFAQAEAADRHAFDLLQPKGLLDTPAYCHISARLGLVLLDTNRPEQAEPYLRHAYSIAVKNVGAISSENAADYQNFLTQAYSRQGLTEEAEKQVRELIEFCGTPFPANSLYTAQAYLTNARILFDDSRMVEAETAFNRALAICEKLQPPDDSLLIRVLNGLGVCLRQQNRTTEAMRHLSRAVDLSRSQNGPASVDTAVVANLSSALIDAGLPDEAIKLLSDVLKIQQNDPNENQVGLAATLQNLGRAYSKVGNVAEAESSFIRSVRVLVAHRKKSGERLPEEQTVLGALRDFYQAQHLAPALIEQKLSAALE